ncbi:hypothetical protein BYT27DRAFT_7213725 [Phlegmacium glaucopus]|nr:hypothetical protein BYT27DRAFT_7213725 [Phlegmacium glaucopus]
MTNFILVSGGVVSGIGKGVIASSTGLLLKTAGLKVTAIKIDPYMNIDAGTMRPTEHGEVYVLNDGGEVDLDLGNYERYLNVTLSRDNNITSGKIYREVIEKESFPREKENILEGQFRSFPMLQMRSKIGLNASPKSQWMKVAKRQTSALSIYIYIQMRTLFMLPSLFAHCSLEAPEERHNEVKIALVGKYTDLKDSGSNHPISSPKYSSQARGVLVPGGFGQRGTEGMMLAITYAREKKIPFLDATSEELVPDVEKPVVVFTPEISKTHMGGTMRLGLRPTVFEAGTEKSSLARKLYAGAPTIWERHRHRYEVNPALVNELSVEGFHFVGKDEKGERMQICELENHPFFLGFQTHPEFCTRPLNPSPPFLGWRYLAEKIKFQVANYHPPHPKISMISKAAMRSASEAVRQASGKTKKFKMKAKSI